ncbi:HPr family phosphocarrier protein [Caproiciproducens galactitolivorans]|uniref:HPr family phosphocarrier protein n=1 Tax=Caproiciproducens galactitolivorans TaxID=642589 RepID=A0ABT4BWW9_9FIRM|nr:HPr family phosphocarrier protein [Caproiciproducens galactitolivorans]MCY1715290.1 HPr family phosphocarrier protein [Caproiciproducens galactitolivorans]
MKEFRYVIQDEDGIHARPAGFLAQEAQKHASEITISKTGKTGNAKKLFSVMSLAAKKGEEVTVKVEGPDEEQAFESIQSFFKTNL